MNKDILMLEQLYVNDVMAPPTTNLPDSSNDDDSLVYHHFYDGIPGGYLLTVTGCAILETMAQWLEREWLDERTSHYDAIQDLTKHPSYPQLNTEIKKTENILKTKILPKMDNNWKRMRIFSNGAMVEIDLGEVGGIGDDPEAASQAFEKIANLFIEFDSEMSDVLALFEQPDRDV